MLFLHSKPVPKQRPDIKVEQNVITHTSEINVLCVIIDENMKWDKHIEATSKRITN